MWMKATRRNKIGLRLALLAVLCGAQPGGLPAAQAADEAPVTIDSRIRTLVYTPNEVFRMYTEFGYQSNIEFSEDEQITTISLGSPSMFKIIPSGNRLFVKALQKDRHTNMTVVTTKRAYQIELFSTAEAEKDVIYVMRFYYPENNIDDAQKEGAAISGNKEASSKDGVAKDGILPVLPGAENKPPETKAAEAKPAPEAEKTGAENYNYSLSGPEQVSPVQVYDNGAATFFKFPEGLAPRVYGVNPEGYEYPLPTRRQGEFLVVDLVLPKFSLREGNDVVCVFNESVAGARL